MIPIAAMGIDASTMYNKNTPESSTLSFVRSSSSSQMTASAGAPGSVLDRGPCQV